MSSFNHEYRVGLTPESVAELTQDGQSVIIETQAGVGIGSSDEDYVNAGAEIVATAAEIFERAEMIIKVKEPQAVERAMLREGQILYTYLHLAPDPAAVFCSEECRALRRPKLLSLAAATLVSMQRKWRLASELM